MKKTIVAISMIFIAGGANAFVLESEKEFGIGEARNQNVIVKCTTSTGEVSNQTCTARRFANCKGNACNDWQPWTNVRNPGRVYGDWRKAATACCHALGLR